MYKIAIIGSGIYYEPITCLCSDLYSYLRNCKLCASILFKTLIQEDGAGGFGCLRIMLQTLGRGCGGCSLCQGLDLSLDWVLSCLSSHLVTKVQETPPWGEEAKRKWQDRDAHANRHHSWDHQEANPRCQKAQRQRWDLTWLSSAMTRGWGPPSWMRCEVSK